MRWNYDMLGHRVYQNSMDGGERWMLNDCIGKPILKWDSKGQQFRTEYDDRHRPLKNFVRNLVTGTETCFEVLQYGDELGMTAALRHQRQAKNLIGQVIIHQDTAGRVENEEFDFKGNLKKSSRELVLDFKAMPDWSAAPALTGEAFVSETKYDALNRPIEINTPDGSVQRPIFNEAGLLNAMKVAVKGGLEKDYVSNIDYDAKGQRTRIDYGNKSATVYDYDPFTFRLRTLVTARNADPQIFLDDKNKLNQPQYKGKVVQYLSYTYDPVGNITYIRDDAQQKIYFANAVVEPHGSYEYDAIYRLISATGREHEGQANTGKKYADQFDAARMINGGLPHPNSQFEMLNYEEKYEYDAVGNMLKLTHKAGTPGHMNNWTKTFEYNNNAAHRAHHPWVAALPENNQLLRMDVGNGHNDRQDFTYDAHGNMNGIGGGYDFTWDALDRLHTITLPNNEKACYQYDTSGERARKTIVKADGTVKEERFYLGALELYRSYHGPGAVALERESLHIMDDTRRIAMAETKTIGLPTPESPDLKDETVVRYQYGNHLGSACLELDEGARVVSCEEYHPYGTTALQLVNKNIKAAAKRYRYTGMERDEESGLNYHSARYYVGWLGRWTTCDPMGISYGPNLFQYCNCNPVGIIDKNGKAPTAADLANMWEQTKFGSFIPGVSGEDIGKVAQQASEKITGKILNALPEGNGVIPSGVRNLVSGRLAIAQTVVDIGAGMFAGAMDPGSTARGVLRMGETSAKGVEEWEKGNKLLGGAMVVGEVAQAAGLALSGALGARSLKMPGETVH